jgi:hypothetical protein
VLSPAPDTDADTAANKITPTRPGDRRTRLPPNLILVDSPILSDRRTAARRRRYLTKAVRYAWACARGPPLLQKGWGCECGTHGNTADRISKRRFTMVDVRSSLGPVLTGWIGWGMDSALTLKATSPTHQCTGNGLIGLAYGGPRWWTSDHLLHLDEV